MKNDIHKILILFGSPHPHGFTNKILKYVTNMLPKSQIIVKRAFEENIKPCIDCSFCKSNTACTFDDMNEIYNLIETSDIMIIAFPVYNSSLPSPLKAIIDRMQKYYNRKFFSKMNNSIIEPKNSLIITTQGSNNYEINTLKAQLIPTLKLLNSREIYHITVSGTDFDNFDMDKYFRKNEKNIKNTIHKLLNI